MAGAMDPTLVTAAIENVLEAAQDQRTLTALYVWGSPRLLLLMSESESH